MNHQIAEAFAKRNLHNIKRVGKVPIWIYPHAQEIMYRAFLIAVVNDLRSSVLALLDRLPAIIAERDREHHTDAWPDNLDTLLTTLRVQFDDTSHKEKIKSRLLDIGQKTSDWNDAQWQKTLLDVLGVDVYRRESFLGSHIKSFVQEGSSLITKLTEDTYNDVTGVLTRSIRAGDRVNTIKDALMEKTDLGPGVFNKVETRARLIARDQIGKFNGELTRVRQESIGIKEYIWHTVEDERVRDEHKALDGMLCRWDDDTVYSDDDGRTWKDRASIGAFIGQPGEDYQCRCWAEAVFPEEVTGEPEEEEEDTTSEEDIAASNVIETEIGFTRADGGKGSGNWEHEGRPGLVGGSGEGGVSSVKKEVDKPAEKKYIYKEREKGAQYEQEGTGEVVNRGTAKESGAGRGAGLPSSSEGDTGVDIGRSVQESGRVVATHHTTSGDVYEIENPTFYRDTLSNLRSEHKYGSSVTLHTKEDYASARTFFVSDGRGCFAITQEGDLQSVIHMEDCKVSTNDLCNLAVRQGAKTLDCFDTVLPRLYSQHGFVEYKRDTWDDQYKPHDWNYELYKKYNSGRPDVVYMRRN